MTEVLPINVESPQPARLGPRLAARQDVGGMLLRRWGGCWIDFIALGVIFFVIGLVTYPLTRAGPGPASAATGLIVLLAILAYFPVTEGLWGRSLGKLITGTVVIDAAGNLPGIPRAIGRTVTRLVEVNPFLLGGIPAGLLVAFSGHRQRLGDMIAGTYVVPYAEWVRARGAISTVDDRIFE